VLDCFVYNHPSQLSQRSDHPHPSLTLIRPDDASSTIPLTHWTYALFQRIQVSSALPTRRHVSILPPWPPIRFLSMQTLNLLLERHSLEIVHYYTDDFARWCPFINEYGHKIQPSRLISAINGGRHFLFTETVVLRRLSSSINLFLEGAYYKARLQKSRCPTSPGEAR
jgi:hypothetical protein